MVSVTEHRPQPDNTGGTPVPPRADVTVLLDRVAGGDTAATDQLLELVYEQLRATAGRYFRAQSADHTLQPTALVHEAYLKLIGNPDKDWDGRAHFCAVAATAMRHILSNHARGKRAEKRGGTREREPLTQIESPSGSAAIDLLVLDEVLGRLAAVDERGSRIVELRYFGGLTNEEIAEVIDASLSTVERTWRRCKAWIKAELEGADGTRGGDA